MGRAEGIAKRCPGRFDLANAVPRVAGRALRKVGTGGALLALRRGVVGDRGQRSRRHV